MTTHRSLVLAVARELLDQRWCDVVAFDLAWTAGGRALVDVAGCTAPSSLDRAARTRQPRPTLAVAEIKRTRADLLSGLRKGQFATYSAGGRFGLPNLATLYATPEALGLPLGGTGPVAVADALVDLEARGLPAAWGVVVVRTLAPRPLFARSTAPTTQPTRHTFTSLRSATRTNADPTDDARSTFAVYAARALAWKVLHGTVTDGLDPADPAGTFLTTSEPAR